MEYWQANRLHTFIKRAALAFWMCHLHSGLRGRYLSLYKYTSKSSFVLTENSASLAFSSIHVITVIQYTRFRLSRCATRVHIRVNKIALLVQCWCFIANVDGFINTKAMMIQNLKSFGHKNTHSIFITTRKMRTVSWSYSAIALFIWAAWWKSFQWTVKTSGITWFVFTMSFHLKPNDRERKNEIMLICWKSNHSLKATTTTTHNRMIHTALTSPSYSVFVSGSAGRPASQCCFNFLYLFCCSSTFSLAGTE